MPMQSNTKRSVKAIYKCLMRDIKLLYSVPHFKLRPALVPEQWGRGDYVSDDYHKKYPLKQLLDPPSLQSFREAEKKGFKNIDQELADPELAREIADLLRIAFRENSELKDDKMIKTKIDEAIAILQELSKQIILAKCSSITATRNVRIEATSQYVPDHPGVKQNMYRFTYRITITNTGDEDAIQVTGRQYTFNSISGHRIALPRNSPGIVGCTPILAPGMSFVYASGIDIDSPIGSVNGMLHIHCTTAQMNRNIDEKFDAIVSPFLLLAPQAL